MNKALDYNQELKDLFYHYTVLYERWSADKLEMAKQGVKLEQLLKEFTARIHEFSKLKEDTRREMGQEIYRLGLELSHQLVNEGCRIIKEDIQKAIDQLQATLENEQETIHRHEKVLEGADLTNQILKFIVVGLSGAIVGMLIKMLL